MQFVDCPGVSMQAAQISLVVVPFRTLEYMAIVFFFWHNPQKIHTELEKVYPASMAPEKRSCDASDPCEFLFEFLFDHQLEWFGLWVTMGLIYYILLLLYAIRLKPEADLHSCVVNGRVGQLKALLSVPDVGLDMNRHGPQGRGGHGRRGQPRRRYPPRQRLGPAAAQRCQTEHAAYTR